MKVSKIKYLLTLLCMCFVQFSFAQSNPSLVRAKVLKNVDYEFTIESASQPALSFNEMTSHIKQFNILSSQGTSYTLEVIVEDDYLGPALFAVEWTKSTSTFPFIEPHLTFYELEIVESIIETEIDVVTTNYGNTESIEIYPLDNDFAGFAPLALSGVAQVMYGTAEITDSNTVIYTPPSISVDNDYIVYTVSDTINEYSSGNILINYVADDPILVDTLHYTITDKQSQLLVLPFDQADITDGAANGQLDSLSSYAYRYIPDVGFGGIDTISITNGNGIVRDFIINVIAFSQEPDYAVDDIYYVAKGGTVTIEPLFNDVKNTFSITEISEELEYVSAGTYQYTPDPDFEGIKQFSYTVDYNSGTASANIYVHVSNYVPQSTLAYTFRTPMEQPLVVKYEIPLPDYDFVTPDQNTPYGYVASYGENDNVTVGCDDVNGEAFFIYYPDPGFVGEETFEIEYCAGDECMEYLVTVEVLGVTSEDCFCTNDCVWEGDTNADGRVNVSDLLPIGKHMGEAGPIRPDGYDFWSAEQTDNWTYNQYDGTNIKHVDANGDGVVSVADTSSISAYYNELHNFVPNQVLTIKDYQLYLIPHATEVDSGDLLVFDLAIGSESSPIKDMHGLSFSIQIGGGFADSSSMYIDFYEDGWLTGLGPSIQMYQIPTDGLVEAALTRTDGLPGSGFGVIGQLGFIVEDEADGIRNPDENVYFGVKIVGASGLTADGAGFLMPEAGVRIKYNTHTDVEKDQDELTDIVISPNPTTDEFTIALPDADEEIMSVWMTDIAGRSHTVNQGSTKVEVGHLPQGMYILNVLTTKGSYVNKVQVIR